MLCLLSIKIILSQKFDTKSKLILTIFTVISIIFTINFTQLLFFFIFAIVLIVQYRLSINNILKKMLVPLPLILSLGLLSYLSDKGNILTFANYSIEYNNLELTIFYVLRSTILVVITILLEESEGSVLDIIYALEELYLPKPLVNIFLLMYRFTLDLQLEAKRILDVRYSRYPDKKWGASLYTFKILGYMIGGIIARAFIRKEIRKDSLLSRGFDGTLHHKPKKFNFNGLTLLWIGSIINIVILFLANQDLIKVGLRL